MPKYRHYRRDMIELLKTIKGMYDPTCVSHFDFINYQKTPLGLWVTDTNLVNITVITTKRNVLIRTVLYPY